MVADAVLATALLVTSLLPVDPPGGPPSDPLTGWAVLLTALGCAALALRRRYPLAVLATTTVAVVVAQLTQHARGPFVITVAIAAYTVATRTDRRTAVLTGAISALAVGAAAVATLRVAWSDPAVVVLLLWFGFAVAGGDAVRSRRAYVAVLEERARRAETTREQEARRRVAEERLRIARELHDVVAHHIALINVQAGVAGHLLPDRTEEAREALAHVRTASRTVLEELATLLGVLRRTGDETAPTDPAPTLDRLGVLVDGFTAAGQQVRWTLEGRPRPLPTAVDLAAYRIVQESLTNAHRHAPGAAVTVRLRYHPAGLTVEVRDDGGPRTGTDRGGDGGGTGLGLLGMRERAESVGGRFLAGPDPRRGWTVLAELPARQDGQERDAPEQATDTRATQTREVAGDRPGAAG
jgi:signal transduction histidine kinase